MWGSLADLKGNRNGGEWGNEGGGVGEGMGKRSISERTRGDAG